MDEITVLASAASLLLGGGIGALLHHAYHDDVALYPASDGYVASFDLLGGVHSVTADSAHVHAAVTQRENGWFCACGLHLHRFSFPTEDGLGKRCSCNEYAPNEEQGDRWQSR